jgi:hypothetical protein
MWRQEARLLTLFSNVQPPLYDLSGTDASCLQPAHHRIRMRRRPCFGYRRTWLHMISYATTGISCELSGLCPQRSISRAHAQTRLGKGGGLEPNTVRGADYRRAHSRCHRFKDFELSPLSERTSKEHVPYLSPTLSSPCLVGGSCIVQLRYEGEKFPNERETKFRSQ